MKQETYNSLGVKFTVMVPETAEEYDTLAGKVGACVDAANANTVYRAVLPGFREGFTELVAQQTNIERAVKDTGRTRTNEDGTKEPILVYAESESEFFNTKVCDARNVEPITFQPLADRFGVGGDKEVKFDPSEKERKAPSGPKKLAEKYVKAGTSIIEGGKLDRWQARHGAADAANAAWTPESIGRRIKELEDAAAKKAREEALLEFAT